MLSFPVCLRRLLITEEKMLFLWSFCVKSKNFFSSCELNPVDVMAEIIKTLNSIQCGEKKETC
jgi:hypothetical protein